MKKVLFAFVFAGAVLSLTLSCGESKKEKDAAAAAELAQKEEEERMISIFGFNPEAYSADTTDIKSGEIFTSVMKRLGMSAGDAFSLSRKCEGVFDLRKMKAGNHIHAYYSDSDSARTLQYAMYEHDKVNLTVFRCTDSLSVWNISKPVEVVRRQADVTITSSLWNDMKAAGAPASLIMNLDDIYQWSVNFFHLQQGDRFKMIYSETICEGEVVAVDTLHFSLFESAAGKKIAAVRFELPGSKQATYWDKGGESLKRMFLKAPLKYSRISSRFSYHRKHPVTGKVKAHTAVDYAAPTGTPIQAIGDGTITKCGWDPTGGGNRIRIKHSRGYESCYMHLSKFAKGMRVGARVSQGDIIGYVGATGTATGPHLDFRVWENGTPIDPLKLNSPASDPLDKKYLNQFNALYDKYMAEISSSADSTAATSPLPNAE